MQWEKPQEAILQFNSTVEDSAVISSWQQARDQCRRQ